MIIWKILWIVACKPIVETEIKQITSKLANKISILDTMILEILLSKSGQWNSFTSHHYIQWIVCYRDCTRKSQTSNVIGLPIYKKMMLKKFPNYRPVSILPYFFQKYLNAWYSNGASNILILITSQTAIRL